MRKRLPNFQRVYDLPERLIDASHRDRRVRKDEAQRELLRMSARRLGVATLHGVHDQLDDVVGQVPVASSADRVASPDRELLHAVGVDALGPQLGARVRRQDERSERDQETGGRGAGAHRRRL